MLVLQTEYGHHINNKKDGNQFSEYFFFSKTSENTLFVASN